MQSRQTPARWLAAALVLVVGLGAHSQLERLDTLWLLALTGLAAGLLARPIGRRGGGLLVAAYLAFLAVQLAYA